MQQNSLLTPHLETSSPSYQFQCSRALPHALSSLFQSSLMNLDPLIWMRPKPATPISQNSWALSAQVSPTQIMGLLVPSSSSVNHADVLVLAPPQEHQWDWQIQPAALTRPVPKGSVLHTRHSFFLAFVTSNSSHLSLLSRYSEEISEAERWQASLEGRRRLQRPMETWEWLWGAWRWEKMKQDPGDVQLMQCWHCSTVTSHLVVPKGTSQLPPVSENLRLQAESMEALFCWVDSRFSSANFTAPSLKMCFSGSVNPNKTREKNNCFFYLRAPGVPCAAPFLLQAKKHLCACFLNKPGTPSSAMLPSQDNRITTVK